MSRTSQYRQASGQRGYEAWIGKGGGFMVPRAEWCDTFDDVPPCEGTDDAIAGWREDFEPGWYAWLTAPGYLDRTDPTGPFPTVFRAVRELCRLYDINVHGEDIHPPEPQELPFVGGNEAIS